MRRDKHEESLSIAMFCFAACVLIVALVSLGVGV